MPSFVNLSLSRDSKSLEYLASHFANVGDSTSFATAVSIFNPSNYTKKLFFQKIPLTFTHLY